MTGITLRLGEIEQSDLSPLTKGLRGDAHPLPLAALGAQGWNLLNEDLSLPVAVVKDSAVARNRAWMRAFLQNSGARLAPHGKTTMAPQILQMQLDDGAWAITAATANQIAVYRHFGVPRILLANQLMGRRNIDFVLGELRRDPGFDFYCLVDSLEGLGLLEEAARRADIGRPLQLLLEVGALDGRTGLRDKAAALEVARAVGRAAPCLTLRGVEGYEGIFRDLGRDAHEARVLAYFETMLDVLAACRAESLFAEGPILLTAGGSDFYDFAARALGRAALDEEILLVLRSGCYITQDNLKYDRDFARILERSPELRGLAPPMLPALEVWGYLQSLPEPGLGFATLGKRDISHDLEMPKPLTYHRPGAAGPPLAIPEGHAVLRLNDQHAHLKLPPDSPLRVGDMVSFGVSHPCTTFDKWQLLLRVDDAYNVTGAIRTFF